jgi:uncharacterized protein
MTSRLISASAKTAELIEEVPPGTEILAGSPKASVAMLAALDGIKVGLWEMSAGRVLDTERDEIFVVIAGAGELRVADEKIALAPGVVVRLYEGDDTEWDVTETVRKVYITPSN